MTSVRVRLNIPNVRRVSSGGAGSVGIRPCQKCNASILALRTMTRTPMKNACLPQCTPISSQRRKAISWRLPSIDGAQNITGMCSRNCDWRRNDTTTYDYQSQCPVRPLPRRWTNAYHPGAPWCRSAWLLPVSGVSNGVARHRAAVACVWHKVEMSNTILLASKHVTW